MVAESTWNVTSDKDTKIIALKTSLEKSKKISTRLKEMEPKQSLEMENPAFSNGAIKIWCDLPFISQKMGLGMGCTYHAFMTMPNCKKRKTRGWSTSRISMLKGFKSTKKMENMMKSLCPKFNSLLKPNLRDPKR